MSSSNNIMIAIIIVTIVIGIGIILVIIYNSGGDPNSGTTVVKTEDSPVVSKNLPFLEREGEIFLLDGKYYKSYPISQTGILKYTEIFTKKITTETTPVTITEIEETEPEELPVPTMVIPPIQPPVPQTPTRMVPPIQSQAVEVPPIQSQTPIVPPIQPKAVEVLYRPNEKEISLPDDTRGELASVEEIRSYNPPTNTTSATSTSGKKDLFISGAFSSSKVTGGSPLNFVRPRGLPRYSRKENKMDTSGFSIGDVISGPNSFSSDFSSQTRK